MFPVQEAPLVYTLLIITREGDQFSLIEIWTTYLDMIHCPVRNVEIY